MSEREPLKPAASSPRRSPFRSPVTPRSHATPRKEPYWLREFKTELSDVALLGGDGKGWNRLVDNRQLQDWPTGTLVCARLTKLLLWLAVFAATFTLIFEYFLGEFGVDTEIIKFTAFAVPNIVICPIWGQKNMTLTVEATSLGDYTTESVEHFLPVHHTDGSCAKFEFEQVNVRTETVSLKPMHNDHIDALGCHCVGFGDGALELRERLVGKEGIFLKFAASFAQDARANLVAIGFSHADIYPTDWAYLETGKRNVAELYMESRAYAKTVLWPGTPVDKFNLVTKAAFPVPGTVQPSAVTELVFFPGSFFVREISDVASIWSAFALTSLVVIVIANLNSVQLFDIIFPEKVDATDPAQIQPSWFCQKACCCLPCCVPLPDTARTPRSTQSEPADLDDL